MTEQSGVSSQQIYDMLMESQYWPPEQMWAYQRSQLEQLLRHAKANVPFYKTRLDCVFRRDGSIDWDRWEEIPIVTREDLRDRREEMQARVLPQGHGSTASFFTSGSTGVPIQFTTTSLSGLARGAGLRRMEVLHGVPSDIVRSHISLDLPDHTPLKRSPEWFPLARKSPSKSTLFVPQRLSAAEKLRLFKENGIQYYYDFATNVVELARANALEAHGISLNFVCTYGMSLLDEEVESVRGSFNCKVISLYSSKECGLIGHSKPRSLEFLQCPELVFVEGLITENQGKQIPVIATPLFNAAQPLIRYNHGDNLLVGGFSARTGLPVISRVLGREDTYFLLDGKRRPVVGVQDARLVSKLRALSVQIAQTSDDGLEVRYVAPRVAPSAERQNIARHLKSVLPGAKSIRFKRMASIPRNAGGKLNRYVRELDIQQQQQHLWLPGASAATGPERA